MYILLHFYLSLFTLVLVYLLCKISADITFDCWKITLLCFLLLSDCVVAMQRHNRLHVSASILISRQCNLSSTWGIQIFQSFSLTMIHSEGIRGALKQLVFSFFWIWLAKLDSEQMIFSDIFC